MRRNKIICRSLRLQLCATLIFFASSSFAAYQYSPTTPPNYHPFIAVKIGSASHTDNWNPVMHLGYNSAISGGIFIRNFGVGAIINGIHNASKTSAYPSFNSLTTSLDLYYRIQTYTHPSLLAYIGGGVGWSHLFSNFLPNNNNLFAYNAVAGLAARLNLHWQLGAEYQFINMLVDKSVATPQQNTLNIHNNTFDFSVWYYF